MIFQDGYYKVVTKDLKSLVHSDHPELTIQYKVGEWTWPNIEETQIFLCEDLLEAKEWQKIKIREYALIFQCQVINPSKNIVFNTSNSSYSTIIWRWLLDQSNLRRFPINDCNYLKTLGADAIKLTKEIY